MLTTATLYQCQRCLTVHDETYGAKQQTIAPGTSFRARITYSRPTCVAPPAFFVAVPTPQSSWLAKPIAPA